MSERVFLDASFWIAYRDVGQPEHARAAKLVIDLFRRRVPFCTTWPVFCEIHAYFSRSLKLRKMVLGDLWKNPVCVIEPVTHEDEKMAMGILENNHDKSYSMCDATSFAVMQRLRIRTALSFDDHFRQFGIFQVLG